MSEQSFGSPLQELTYDPELHHADPETPENRKTRKSDSTQWLLGPQSTSLKKKFVDSDSWFSDHFHHFRVTFNKVIAFKPLCQVFAFSESVGSVSVAPGHNSTMDWGGHPLEHLALRRYQSSQPELNAPWSCAIPCDFCTIWVHPLERVIQQHARL